MTMPCSTPRLSGPISAMSAKTNSMPADAPDLAQRLDVDQAERRRHQDGAERRDRKDRAEPAARNRSVATRAAAAAIEATCERPPTVMLTAVRESEAVTGKAPKSPAAMLAAPKPVSSRFGSTS